MNLLFEVWIVAFLSYYLTRAGFHCFFFSVAELKIDLRCNVIHVDCIWMSLCEVLVSWKVHVYNHCRMLHSQAKFSTHSDSGNKICKLWSNFSSISFEDVPDFPYVGFVLYVYTFSLPFVFAPPHPSRSACLLYFLWCYFEWLFHINMCTVNTAIYFRYVYMCMNSRIRTWVNSVGWMYDSRFHNFTRTYHIYFFLSIICLNR